MVERQEAWSSRLPGRSFPAQFWQETGRCRGCVGQQPAWCDTRRSTGGQPRAHSVSVLDAGHTQWACLVPADVTPGCPGLGAFTVPPPPGAQGCTCGSQGTGFSKTVGEGAVAAAQEKVGQQLRLTQTSRENLRQGPVGLPSCGNGSPPLFFFFCKHKMFRAAVDSRLSFCGPPGGRVGRTAL